MTWQCTIIPYTFEDNSTPDPDKKGLVMLQIENEECTVGQCLDNIPDAAARILNDVINAR